MEPHSAPKNRRLSLWILGAFVLILLTFLILLQTSNLWKEFSIVTASDTILLYALSSLNFIALVIFGFIFLRSIIKLARERRSLQLGAKIKTRLLVYFFAISLLPIIAMAVFSFLFMNRALDRWFTQIPENVIREAREVQARAVADRWEKLSEASRMLGSVLEHRDLSAADLAAIARAGNLARIEILSKDNKSLGVSGPALDDARRIELEQTLNFIRGGNFEDPALRDGIGFDAAVTPLDDGRRLLLVSNFASSDTVSGIVDTSLVEFDRLKEKQVTVRQVGFLTLGVLTFLLIFASSWTALYIARGLTVPIKALAEGANEIAAGKLGHRVEVLAEDELALLVSAFNQMSVKLEENSAELSDRRKYIETVLQSLPIGVISLDADNRISTINKAAKNILRLDSSDLAGAELKELVKSANYSIFDRLISRSKRIGHASEQTNLQYERAQTAGAEPVLPAALTATALPDNNGVVLLIEDLSELITAQRASAWQEVARRMAHEIKNPLTPIQLSAERIAKRFAGLSGNGGPEAQPAGDEMLRVVDESTTTIIREVQSLKTMVDEFSRFARLPTPKLGRGDLNEIVRQVSDLYADRTPAVTVDLRLAQALPATQIDAEQMKRVFVNLFDNAIEARPADVPDAHISVTTRHEAARDIIVIEVADDGDGIPPRDFQKLFQPHFSTKGRGTGLGLAIVQRTVSEHSGKIKAAPNSPKGAKFIIELPVISN